MQPLIRLKNLDRQGIHLYKSVEFESTDKISSRKGHSLAPSHGKWEEMREFWISIEGPECPVEVRDMARRYSKSEDHWYRRTQNKINHTSSGWHVHNYVQEFLEMSQI